MVVITPGGGEGTDGSGRVVKRVRWLYDGDGGAGDGGHGICGSDGRDCADSGIMVVMVVMLMVVFVVVVFVVVMEGLGGIKEIFWWSIEVTGDGCGVCSRDVRDCRGWCIRTIELLVNAGGGGRSMHSGVVGLMV